MSYSKRSRYSRSPSYRRYSRSLSRSLSCSRSRSRSPSRDVDNPGNNLYVTGLSPRITKRELEKHFATEGKVVDVHLVVDPWTRESRGFGFVTMSNVEEARCCLKYLNQSVLEGRVITVEKARRRRGRTPTPGRYLGLRTVHVRRRSPSYSPRRSPSYSSFRGSRSRSRSPGYSSERSRSYSPYSRSRRSYPPHQYHRGRRYGSPDYYNRRRSYSRSQSPYRRSPLVTRQDRSYSPYDQYYARRISRRSHSRSVSPRRRSARRSARRSYSRSISPEPRRGARRGYGGRSPSPRSRSWKSRGRYSRESYSSRSSSRSRSVSVSSRSVSGSVSSRSASPSS